MYKFLISLFLAGCVFGCCCALLAAQEKKAESPPVVREAPTVPYLLAGIGLILVMVLVCMPARRD
jgi:hypothetical protein